MNPIITAFAQSPDGGRGLARDMAVRWALEEVNQPYDVRLLSLAAMKEPAHRALQPFGQIPTFEDGTLALFESAAIVLHVAECHPGLLPEDANTRARVIAWMFAAKGTVEPPVVERSMAILFETDRTWHAERLSVLDERVRVRLGDISRGLADRDWLEGEFWRGRHRNGDGTAPAGQVRTAGRASDHRWLCGAGRSATGFRARVRGATRGVLRRDDVGVCLGMSRPQLT